MKETVGSNPPRGTAHDEPAWALPPEYPPQTVTFTCVDFGGYRSNGYDPNKIAGRISGIPIQMLTEGQWLGNTNTGSSGSQFLFYDKEGKELGRVWKPSLVVVHELLLSGKWPQALTFTPSPAAA